MTTNSKDDVIFEVEDFKRLHYRVNESPPIYLTLLFGIQQSMLSLSKSLTVCILVAELVCSDKDEYIRTKLFSSTLLMSGICTLLQSTVGIRLPLYQGPSAAYVVPLLALAPLKEWRCPSFTNFGSANLSLTNSSAVDSLYREHVIIPKIQLLSGSLLVAGCIHSVIGLTGMVGAILRFVGPLTVVPAITLIGIFMVNALVKFISTHWGVGLLTTVTAIVLSLYLAHKNTPIPCWGRKRGFFIKKYPLHKVLSILIAMVVGWIVSFILTETGPLTSDPTNHQYLARTDARSHIISEIGWFSIPYPGQFGRPNINVGVFASFLIATFLSIIDSLGDYYACAKVCQEPPPPSHAVNRGIFIEGIASTLSGAVGIGHATSTIGGNIGAIGVTRVASRRVFQAVGFIYIVFGIVGKIGAFFISIPYSVLGGVQIVNFGILFGVVLSNLSLVDLNSLRNVSILGISLLMGLMIPHWARRNPDTVTTGSEQGDSVIRSLLSNPAIIGGGLACFLDNTCPGSLKERGLIGWQVDVVEDTQASVDQMTNSSDSTNKEVPNEHANMTAESTVYDIPFLPSSWRTSSWFKKVPILPGYRQTRGGGIFKKCQKRN